MLLMGVINRKSGAVSGSVKPFQAMVATVWNGIQVLRSFGRGIEVLPTNAANEVRGKVTELTQRWHEVLTLDQQKLWDNFAGTLGSGVDRERSDNVSRSKYIIPRHRKVMTGLNAYIRSNVAGFLAGGTFTTPADTPPTGVATPPPPLQVVLTYATGNANLTWQSPTLSGTTSASKLRMFAKLFMKGGYAQLVQYADVSATSASFTEMRIGKSWGSPKVQLSAIVGPVILRVQMDTIIQRNATTGAVTGPGSNVAEATVTN